MKNSRNRMGALLAGAAMMGLLPSIAMAQSNPDQGGDNAATDTEDSSDIVVTGTLIRGTAPVGSNTLSLGQVELEETGAISSNALVASIPQVTNYFNSVPVAELAIAVNQIQISRPDIRNLSVGSGSATLILVDGHRVASAGVNRASVDPDLIPTGAIERVEVVTEGGSATYGADAVAGVINFITRRKFDGVKVGGHYGIADNYWQYDANATVGKSWDNGSVYVSYNYTKNDALYGSDRGFIRNLDYSSLPYRGRDIACPTPNLTVNTIVFGNVVASTPLTNNRCDNSQNATRTPSAERHGVLGGLSWDFGDKTRLDVRGYWGQRKTLATSDLTGSAPVNGNNPYATGQFPAGLTLGNFGIPIGGGVVIPATNVAAVNFSLRPLLGANSQRSSTLIAGWGGRAELTHDITDDWQVRALANWSESNSKYNLTGINGTRLNAASAPAAQGTTANSFNPFNVINNNAALITDLLDEEIAGQARDRLVQLRLLAEGKLFELPGGDVRVAVGAEYTSDKLRRRFQPTIRQGTLGTFPYSLYKRNVKSLYGEINLPLIGDGDGGSMLTVAGSGRYDKYSDFGSTFNPKVGVTFEPVKGFKLRGNYGTSFTAPTPVDQLGSLTSTISSFNFVPFTPVGGPQPLPGTNVTIALQGSKANLQPQEADTWSVGFDLEPTEGLKFSASYYDVKYNNILRTPTLTNAIFTDFPNSVVYNVNGISQAQITSFFTGLGAPQAAQLSAILAGLGGNRVTEIVDVRIDNLGIIKLNGVDASMNVNHATRFGSLDFGLNVNIPLTRDEQVSPAAGVIDAQRYEIPNLYLKSQLGANFGAFRAQATWNHTGGFDILPTTSVPVQDHVKSFNTIDLFFKYDVPGESRIFKDLSLTLNVSNVFDQNPSVLLRNGQNEVGYSNTGFTLGRMFIFGISKKF